MNEKQDQTMTPKAMKDAAVLAVKILQDAGYTAYFAGGCVRDSLMELTPKDYDIATNATPQQVGELFHKAQKVGEAFGVMLVRLQGYSFEVATFRTDGDYTDGRRPDSVCFSTPEHDAERRDFTINGMFYDPIADQLHDFVGGEQDIESKTLCCIGEPDRRFGEDYLRMLRAVRFAARFDLQIEERTELAIRSHVDQLHHISKERIGMEVRSMLKHPNRKRAIMMLDEYGLSNVILNENRESFSEHRVMRDIPGEMKVSEGLIYWFLYRYVRTEALFTMIKPSIAEFIIGARTEARRMKHVARSRQWRQCLNLSNEETTALVEGIDDLIVFLQWSEIDKAKRKRLLARKHHRLGFMTMTLIDSLQPQGPSVIKHWGLKKVMQELKDEGVAPTPLLNGADIIAAGHEPGPVFSEVLHQVYDAQLNNELHSKEEALSYAKKLLSASD